MTTNPKASKDKKAAPKKSASLAEEELLKVVGVRELRQQASRVLDLVKKGEVIVVTEHGKPIAEIVPIKKTKLERLIEQGAVTPAKKPFDADLWNNTDGPRYPNGVEEFLKERREARY
ncbi:Phd Antitoxin of toxin-antitoxin stability system [Candidatus Nanopelagicaceae bacterium]